MTSTLESLKSATSKVAGHSTDRAGFTGLSAADTEALLKHGTEAMNRRDYSAAATLFAIAGGSAGAGHGREQVLYNRAIRNLVPRV